MCSNYQFLLFTILILFPWGGKSLDGWKPIKNLSNTKVVDIGKFAVARHNFEAKTRLVFHSLASGQTLSRAAGTEYNVTIVVKDGDDDDDDTFRDYVAIVSERPNQEFMHLVSFKGPV